MIHPTFASWNMENKKIFLRADLNVSRAQGKIINDFRLSSILPTIDFILKKKGTIVLATHIGRPQNKEPELSTQLLIPWFKQRGYAIQFIPSIHALAQQPTLPQQIFLLENLRFFPGEKNGDIFFAKELARTAHYYINDAFGVVHEHDCSVSLLPYEFPENRRSIGLLMEKELRALSMIKNNPEQPFLTILGGGKVADKIPMIQKLLPKINSLALYPAICFSFLKALGKPVGKSLVDDSLLDTCKKIILEAENSGVSCLFPLDYQIAENSQNGSLSIISADKLPDNAMGISVGPQTVAALTTEINHAKTIFFNCAMGFSDRPTTQQSSRDIIDAMAKSSANTIVAGGDSVDIALTTSNYQLIDHLSTGGGAALAYLSDAVLPGLAPFEED